MAILDVQGKNVSEMMVDVSHLYRALMHTTPSFVLREEYKGTPDSPSPIKGRHDYVVELGFWQPCGDKGAGKTFQVVKTAKSTSFEKAIQALVTELNTEW